MPCAVLLFYGPGCKNPVNTAVLHVSVNFDYNAANVVGLRRLSLRPWSLYWFCGIT